MTALTRRTRWALRFRRFDPNYPEPLGLLGTVMMNGERFGDRLDALLESMPSGGRARGGRSVDGEEKREDRRRKTRGGTER